MKAQVFFDYACPYCYRGHALLMDYLKDKQEIEIEWCPCESHPRPDRYGMHSDLCIEGMFFAQAEGIDILRYHEMAYRAANADRINIEDKKMLAEYFSELLDGQKLYEVLKAGVYTNRLNQANDFAYRKTGIWVVPAVLYQGKKLEAVEDVGIRREQLVSLFHETAKSRGADGRHEFSDKP